METIKNHSETTLLHHTPQEIEEAIAQRAATEAMIQAGIENKQAADQLRAAGYEISEDPRTPVEILADILKSAPSRV